MHYQDVWRFNLFTYIWTQVCTSSSSSSSFQIHLPSARRRAIACLHIAAPNISSNNDDGDNNNNNNNNNNSLSMKQKPRVYVFGGTQPRVLNKKINNYSQSLHHMSTTTTNSTSTSASFYNSLPHRRSLNINWLLCIQSNSSDNGNGMKCGGGGGGDGSGGSTPNNASSFSNTTITKFHLIIIMPRDNPPIRDNFFVLSNLFIINYDELSVVFNDSSTTSTTTSNTSNVSHSSFIRHLLTSAFQNSLSIDDDINSLRDNRSAEKVFFIFKLAWLTLCTRRDSSVCRTRCHGDDDKTDNTEASSSSSASASSSQFHIYFILSDVLVGEEILLD
ncbi:unnamed protein product [Trichobilharzia regenti]|nr:unnamed protein product [Trichobilharzia regenti]